MREAGFLLGLTAAGGLIVRGVALLSTPAAWMVAGVLLAVIVWLSLVDDGQASE